MNYKFKFSIIMAVYNVEKYIEETLESVIDQTIGFKENIQIILVNDGSHDNSGKICEHYKKKFPENIVYLKKENGGVSTARNEGLEHVEGKYVNFLDPDDKLSRETLKNVFNYFEKNEEDIDLVAIPIYLFEGGKGNHILNYKFKKTRIINIFREHNCPQLSAASSFIKSSVLKDVRFDERLTHAEDAKLVNEIILKKMKYGVLKEGKYWYRKRTSGDSALQTGAKKLSWYVTTLEHFAMSLIETSQAKFGFVPKYIQFVIMYDIQWKIKMPNLNNEIFSEEMKGEYKKTISSILKHINSSIIWEQKHINIYQKNYAFKLKYGNDFQKKQLYKNDAKLYVKDNILLNKLSNQTVIIEFMEIKNGSIYLEGHFGSLFDAEECKLEVSIGGKRYSCQRIKRDIHDIVCLDEVVKSYYGFKFEIPLKEIGQALRLEIVANYHGAESNLRIRYKKFSKLTYELNKSYCKKDNYLVSFEERGIIIEPSSAKRIFELEVEYLKQLYNKKEKGAILYRLIYWLFYLKLSHEKIWIFMDRMDKADDNAEHLFRYSNLINDGIKKYFIISKDSNDFERMQRYGKVIAKDSLKHKILYLFSEKIISSHADEWVINPFYRAEGFYRGLRKNNFIFLQHGITKDDLSGWLNKYAKNIKMFLTAGKQEYKSILEFNYNYNEKDVALLGFPRFDNLKRERNKQILIMPTWRQKIVAPLNQQNGIRPYSDNFKETEYFKNYNRLINDERILKKVKELGYKLVFFPHPNIQQQMSDFEKNELLEIPDYNTSYQKLFNESDLLITDYSSVYFDFSYTKKPVLYYQFDKDKLYDIHTYDEGYFDYETMGFGDVITEYKELVSKILVTLENGCKMEDKYRKRVDEFFAYTDKNNCKRVYEAILEMER